MAGLAAVPPALAAGPAFSYAGTALAHMLCEDTAAARHAQTSARGPTTRAPLAWPPAEQPGHQPDQNPPDQTTSKPRAPGRTFCLPKLRVAKVAAAAHSVARCSRV
jgi:hypothetical protein